MVKFGSNITSFGDDKYDPNERNHKQHSSNLRLVFYSLSRPSVYVALIMHSARVRQDQTDHPPSTILNGETNIWHVHALKF